MLRIGLYEPEIPPNTGNIIRLCANTGAELHLIEPLGFTLEEKQLRRAGLDYREFATVRVHKTLDAMREALDHPHIWGLSTKGQRSYAEVSYQEGDVLLFGPETRGLPDAVRNDLGDQLLRIPMREDSRSLNLSNSAALVLYEGLRQLSFPGLN